MLLDMEIHYLWENIKNIYWLDTSKRVVYRAVEFLRNEIAVAVTKSNYNKIAKQEPIEKTLIPPEKK